MPNLTVAIVVEGYEDVFIRVGTPIGVAADMIRTNYGLQWGTIMRNGECISFDDLLDADGGYSFRNFQRIQTMENMFLLYQQQLQELENRFNSIEAFAARYRTPSTRSRTSADSSATAGQPASSVASGPQSSMTGVDDIDRLRK